MATDVRTRPKTGDNRIDFRASWEFYLALSEALDDPHVLLAYDGERVELMSPGMHHEFDKILLDRLVSGLAGGLAILCLGMSQSRWVRPEAQRGLGADESYYLSVRKIERAKLRPKDDADYPTPDLALEIDMSPSKIDRPGVYAALGVAEVWRFDGDTVRIDVLGPHGTYAEAEQSALLGVTPAEILELLDLEFLDHNDFMSQVTAWAAAELRPRRPSWFLP